MAKSPQSSRKALGEAIRSLRKKQKISQEDLAFDAGVHRTYMGALERGERNVSLENIIKVAGALHIKAAELFRIAGI
jgi:transcriptional regulator with XRE-family HTH domain